jgi:hypothetical protein
MGVEQFWTGVAFVPEAGEPIQFGAVDVDFPGRNEYRTEGIDIRIHSPDPTAVPKIREGTRGTFRGTNTGENIGYAVVNAEVVRSSEGDLLLRAESLDGVTNPIATILFYAVFDDRANSITFVKEIPKEFEGRYEAEVILDPPPADLNIWPQGTDRPEVVLCVAEDDPKHYRVYKYRRDIAEGFRSTGRNYGGVERRPFVPTRAVRRRAEIRARNAGRWIAWTRGLGRAVAIGDTRDEAIARAAHAGVLGVVCEFIPPAIGAPPPIRP